MQEPETLPPDVGPIFISGPVDGMVRMTWENEDAILQSSESLAPESWTVVSDAEGELEWLAPVNDPSANYFRLTLP